MWILLKIKIYETPFILTFGVIDFSDQLQLSSRFNKLSQLAVGEKLRPLGTRHTTLCSMNFSVLILLGNVKPSECCRLTLQQ